MEPGIVVQEPERSAPEALAALLSRIWPTLVARAHGRLPSFARHRAHSEDLVDVAGIAALNRSDSIDPDKPRMAVRFERPAILDRIRDQFGKPRLVEGCNSGERAAVDSNPSPSGQQIESDNRRLSCRALLHIPWRVA